MELGGREPGGSRSQKGQRRHKPTPVSPPPPTTTTCLCYSGPSAASTFILDLSCDPRFGPGWSEGCLQQRQDLLLNLPAVMVQPPRWGTWLCLPHSPHCTCVYTYMSCAVVLIFSMPLTPSLQPEKLGQQIGSLGHKPSIPAE